MIKPESILLILSPLMALARNTTDHFNTTTQPPSGEGGVNHFIGGIGYGLLILFIVIAASVTYAFRELLCDSRETVADRENIGELRRNFLSQA